MQMDATVDERWDVSANWPELQVVNGEDLQVMQCPRSDTGNRLSKPYSN